MEPETLELPPLKCEACGERLSILDLDAEAKCPCGSDQVFTADNSN